MLNQEMFEDQACPTVTPSCILGKFSYLLTVTLSPMIVEKKTLPARLDLDILSRSCAYTIHILLFYTNQKITSLKLCAINNVITTRSIYLFTS